MIPELGRGLVLLATLFATVGCFIGFEAGYRKQARALKLTVGSAWGFALSMIAANALMIYALVTKDFSVGYVAEVGSHASPLHISIVSLWASLNGSILFWGGVLGVYVLGFVVFLGNKHREYVPYTLHVLLGISIFFSLMVATVADPFHRVSPVPLDGPGPNALLQNHWLMALHPPTLYLGYVGMALPFAMLCAALYAGRLDAGWMAPLRRATLIPWVFLTIGIVLGGWWSYGVLGWGGYWAWDPVENASFHPWLTGTAFLHSAMVLQRRGSLRDWTMVLGMSTFLLTLVGTFMTRSGVFNSVHSFTQSTIGIPFLWFIFGMLVYSVALLALRTHTLDDDREQRFTWSPLGRELAILLQNGMFAVFTFTVLLGTLYPLVGEWYDGRRVSVGEPYFDRWALPLGIVMVFLMGVGPALPWGRLAPGKAVQKFSPPLLVGALCAGVGAAFGFTKLWTVVTLFLCGFALQSNLGEFITPVRQRMQGKQESAGQAVAAVFRKGRRRWGGLIAHLGILMAVVGIALSKGYKIERDFTFSAQQTGEVAGYELRYLDQRTEPQPHRTSKVVRFAVSDDGTALGDLEPRLNYYRTMREPIGTPAIRTGADRDLYLSLIQVDEDTVTVRAMVMPGVVWIWIAAAVIGLGTLIALLPASTARARAPQAAATTAEKGMPA